MLRRTYIVAHARWYDLLARRIPPALDRAARQADCLDVGPEAFHGVRCTSFAIPAASSSTVVAVDETVRQSDACKGIEVRSDRPSRGKMRC